MAIAHTRMKALSRSQGNTVRMMAYRSGCKLFCERTGEHFDYRNKNVSHVEFLIPADAPQWARELAAEIARDRKSGVQRLVNLAESYEKRVDSQVWREWEFSLPRELNDSQCIELAREYMQDQACGRGIAVLLNFHMDVDPETGERKPHCHATMLTRRLTEEGLSWSKEREWERRGFAKMLREEFAAYTNFHLEKHGFDVRIDPRTYGEQGIEMEPQPKLGKAVREIEAGDPVHPREREHPAEAGNFDGHNREQMAGAGSDGVVEDSKILDFYASVPLDDGGYADGGNAPGMDWQIGSPDSSGSSGPRDGGHGDHHTNAPDQLARSGGGAAPDHRDVPHHGDGPRHGDVQGQRAKTERGETYRRIALRNLARLIRNPEMVLDIVTRNHVTFMWGDVEKVLTRYINDPVLYQRMNERLKASSKLVLLRERAVDGRNIGAVYTTREMVRTENDLVRLAGRLENRIGHRTAIGSRQKILDALEGKLKAYGGLSGDQRAALAHMVRGNDLACIVGYAGSGKTTVLEAAKEIWEASGYRVYGLAPTGRAEQNLASIGIRSMTVHKFLHDYRQGRNHLSSQSVIILDEAGMVDVRRFRDLLGAASHLGVKIVTVGDGAQLQPVEAGASFRLVTERISHARLETVVRQKEAWQQDATRLLGMNRTAEALRLYAGHGCIRIVKEDVPSLDGLIRSGDCRAIVEGYNQARKVAGTIWHDIIQDLERKYPLDEQVWRLAPSHRDHGLFSMWKNRRQVCAEYMVDHLEECRPLMEELGVDGIAFAAQFTGGNPGDPKARELAMKWQLPLPDHNRPAHVCDIRSGAREALMAAWKESIHSSSGKSHIILTYTNQDTRDLNDAARAWMRSCGVLKGKERTFRVVSEQVNDFGGVERRHEDRSFAVGDRLVFLHNDRGLGVKNGMLGTVLEMDANRIRVRVDGEDRVVSFAPRLYGEFDHGWATTIHKAQGVTVDRSFVLATHQTFRNLSYVALTRHRESVQAFGSDLDFWREEKVFEAMSESREKLSSLDYVDPARAMAMVREDDGILRRSLQRVGDSLEAIRAVPVEAWNRTCERFLGYARKPFAPLVEEVMSEEERARWMERTDLTGELSRGGERAAPEKTPVGGPDLPRDMTQDQVSLPLSMDSLAGESAEKPVPEREVHLPDTRKDKPVFRDIMAYRPEDVMDSLSPMDVERLFIDHVGCRVENPVMRRQGDNIRFGRSGGFVANVRTGMWYDHYRGEGGDLFKFIADARNITRREAVEWVGEGCGACLSVYVPADELRRRHEAALQERQREEEERRQRGHERASELHERSVPAKGTPAERYLGHVRGIRGEIPDDIRFVSRRWNEGKSLPALVAFGRDGSGKLTCWQEIFLDAETARKASGLQNVKKTHGALKGSCVRLQSGEGITYIVEGLETGLSLKEAGVRGEILVSLGQSNMRNLTPQSTANHVVFCGDYDGEARARTEETMAKTVAHMEKRGYRVSVVWPAREGSRKLDFNDILKEGGPSRIREILQAEGIDLDGRKSSNTLAEKDLLEQYMDCQKGLKELPSLLNSSRDDNRRRSELLNERGRLAALILKDDVMMEKVRKGGFGKEIRANASFWKQRQERARERDAYGLGR